MKTSGHSINNIHTSDEANNTQVPALEAALPIFAFSIPAFCKSVGGITRQHFYAQLKLGKGPRIFRIGKRTLISVEAAQEWVRRMESETDQGGE